MAEKKKTTAKAPMKAATAAIRQANAKKLASGAEKAAVPAATKSPAPKPAASKLSPGKQARPAGQARDEVLKGKAAAPAKLAAKPASKPVVKEAPAVAAAPAKSAKSKPAAPAPAVTVGKPVAAAKAAASPTRPTPDAAPAPAPAHIAAPVAPAVAATRTMAHAVSKPMAMKGATTPASPKEIAQRAAASASAASAAAASAAAKKPVSSRHGFKTNEYIVYPAHGVGRIVGIEEQEIAGMSLELFVITFDKDKLTLRVPTGKLQSVGMRKLAEEPVVKKAMETLKGRARIKRTMWSRRAQEYEAKINSGDLVSIAEVVRDLYRSEAQPEQSYSERQLYEAALDRMAREIAAVERLDERGAVQRITEVLSRSAKGRRAAAEGLETGEPEAAEIKAA